MTEKEVGEIVRDVANQFFSMIDWPTEKKQVYYRDMIPRLERFPADLGHLGIAKAIQDRRWRFPPSPAEVEDAISDYADMMYLRWRCFTKTLKRDGSCLPGAAWFETLKPGEAGKIINGARWGK